MNKKIFLVEDHPLMQRTLHEFIRRLPDFEVCGTFLSAESALECLCEVTPDLILVDMSLPHMNGIDLIKIVQERWPGTLCVLLSGHGELSYVHQAIAAGARGYILKGHPAEIYPALQQVMAGEIFLSEGLAEG